MRHGGPEFPGTSTVVGLKAETDLKWRISLKSAINLANRDAVESRHNSSDRDNHNSPQGFASFGGVPNQKSRTPRWGRPIAPAPLLVGGLRSAKCRDDVSDLTAHSLSAGTRIENAGRCGRQSNVEELPLCRIMGKGPAFVVGCFPERTLLGPNFSGTRGLCCVSEVNTIQW